LRRENRMQKQRQEHAAPEDMSRAQGAVITPASGRGMEGVGSKEVAGYAIHTGEARSTEDVTIRDGTAPIIERGEAAEEEVEENLAESTASSQGAPD
jgi:hypothetical protein